ncbi:hypothetical protein GCM10025860_20220 [Methanobacterium ferruginis]|nr:hypothetical protein GCM10025860_20220 [Methanobacterium ferruginis]
MSKKDTIKENIKLIFSKEGLSLVLKPYNTLSYENKLKSAIPLSIYLIPCYFLFSYLLFGVSMGIDYLPFFFTLCTLSVTMILYYHFYEKFKKNMVTEVMNN